MNSRLLGTTVPIGEIILAILQSLDSLASWVGIGSHLIGGAVVVAIGDIGAPKFWHRGICEIIRLFQADRREHGVWRVFLDWVWLLEVLLRFHARRCEQLLYFQRDVELVLIVQK